MSLPHALYCWDITPYVVLTAQKLKGRVGSSSRDGEQETNNSEGEQQQQQQQQARHRQQRHHRNNRKGERGRRRGGSNTASKRASDKESNKDTQTRNSSVRKFGATNNSSRRGTQRENSRKKTNDGVRRRERNKGISSRRRTNSGSGRRRHSRKRGKKTPSASQTLTENGGGEDTSVQSSQLVQENTQRETGINNVTNNKAEEIKRQTMLSGEMLADSPKNSVQISPYLVESNSIDTSQENVQIRLTEQVVQRHHTGETETPRKVRRRKKKRRRNKKNRGRKKKKRERRRKRRERRRRRLEKKRRKERERGNIVHALFS